MMPLSVLFSTVTSKDVVRDLPLNEENQESVFQGKIMVTLSENIVGDGMTFITDIGFYSCRIINLESSIFEDVFIVSTHD